MVLHGQTLDRWRPGPARALEAVVTAPVPPSGPVPAPVPLSGTVPAGAVRRRRRSGRRTAPRDLIQIKPQALATTALFSVVIVGSGVVVGKGSTGFALYGITVAALLLFKLTLSLLPPQQWPQQAPDLRTCVVIPIYNEDPALLLRTLQSIDIQDRPPTFVVIVDDGSDDDEAFRVAQRWAQSAPTAIVHRQPSNRGKREAMSWAFTLLEGVVDVWVCIDSDTVLDQAAISEGLRPFADPTVTAATGTVVALNPSAGLLPRLIDLRYVNAFLYERAAYSRLGSVLCACGSLAFYRADVVTKNLQDFRTQTFLGKPAVFGDDRRMTNYALMDGQVVLARAALARTAVPVRFGHYLRQQKRWGKSFFRESTFALRALSPQRVAWWLTALELASWLWFTGAVLFSLVVAPLLTAHLHPWSYLAWVLLTGYARSVHVLSIRRTDWTMGQQAVTFALAPLYGLMHLTVLLPLRLWSLLTLASGSWGTRADGVEVSA